MLRLLFVSMFSAIVLGYLARGRLGNLADTRFRWGWIGIAGVVLQFLPVTGRLGDLVLTLSFLLLFVVAGVNWRLPGFVLILAGLWMNFVVITVNQGMPVTREAIVASGQADTLKELKQLDSPKHHIKTADDQLMMLGDLIGIPAPIKQAVSIGDLAAIAGVMWFVIGAMRRRVETAALPAETVSERAAGEAPPATSRVASAAEVS